MSEPPDRELSDATIAEMLVLTRAGWEQVPCDTCTGTGTDDSHAPWTFDCHFCGGSGHLWQQRVAALQPSLIVEVYDDQQFIELLSYQLGLRHH